VSSQHLSDEAVAAFADGFLTGHARERATRHTGECAECAYAVKVQREAAWALRAAPAPSLPFGLADRLRCVPQNTPITALPTAVDADGSMMLSTLAPMASLAPHTRERSNHRARPIVTTAAVFALAGALGAGLAVRDSGDPLEPGTTTSVRQFAPGVSSGVPATVPVSLFRSVGQ
jgi:anti-sigma factor RsiW